MDEASSQPPWEAEDAFPPKPEGQEYGYMKRGRLIPCSRDELVAKYKSREIFRVKLVWTPETPRLVPPVEVPFLWEAVRDATLRRLRSLIGLCILACLIFGAGSLGRNVQLRPFAAAYLIMLGLVPLLWAYRRARAIRAAVPGDGSVFGRTARFRAWLSMRRMRATWLLLACLSAGWACQMFAGVDDSIGAAGFDRPMIRIGEYWRLVTGSFLHLGFGHFIGNFIELAILGWAIEALANRHHLAIVFFGSCLAGGIASVAASTYDVTVGASDALSGLLGFLAFLAFRKRNMLPAGFWRWILWFLVVSGIGELAMRGEVNHAAHAGGFLAGLLSGAILIPGGGSGMPLMASPSGRGVGRIAFGLILAATAGVVAASAAGHRGISALHGIAYEADEDEDYEEAIKKYTEILRIDPTYIPAYFGRASAKWSLNDLEGARDDYDALLKIDPDYTDGLLWRGTVRAELGDLEGALVDLDRKIRIDPQNADGYVERAWIQCLLGEFDRAIENCQRALTLSPKHPYAINTRGRARAAKGNLDGAIHDYSLAIRWDPEHEYAYANRGDAKRRKGDLPGALADFETALGLDDTDPEALMGRGLVRREQGDLAGAKADFEAALNAAHRWWRRRGEAEEAIRVLEKDN